MCEGQDCKSLKMVGPDCCIPEPPAPQVKGGLVAIAEIKRIIQEHYPCYEEDDDEDKVELEVAIAEAQLAHCRKVVEDVKAGWKTEEGEPEYYGAINACDDILKELGKDAALKERHERFMFGIRA